MVGYVYCELSGTDVYFSCDERLQSLLAQIMGFLSHIVTTPDKYIIIILQNASAVS